MYHHWPAPCPLRCHSFARAPPEGAAAVWSITAAGHHMETEPGHNETQVRDHRHRLRRHWQRGGLLVGEAGRGRCPGREQFALGHDRGSSQDHSRIIRRSYHDPSYTTLAGPAYAFWSEIEAESGVQLIFKTGGLDLELIGTTGPKDLSHCAQTMAADNIAYDDLSAAEVMARWPQFQLPECARLYQADAGLVDAGKANAVHLHSPGSVAQYPRSSTGASNSCEGELGGRCHRRRGLQRGARGDRCWRLDERPPGTLGTRGR